MELHMVPIYSEAFSAPHYLPLVRTDTGLPHV